MGLWIFLGLIGAGTYVGIRRMRSNPLLRAIGANMNSYAEANRGKSAELIILPEREVRDRFEPVEVLAARRVA